MTKIFQILFILFLSYSGCSEDKSMNYINIPLEDDTTILSTDEFGNILGGDTTDWCYTNGNGSFELYAAYPNPTNHTCTIRFDIPLNIHVKLYFKNGQDTLFLINQPLDIGTYQTTFYNDSLHFSNQYKRIYMRAGDFYCYGDIKFN